MEKTLLLASVLTLHLQVCPAAAAASGREEVRQLGDAELRLFLVRGTNGWEETYEVDGQKLDGIRAQPWWAQSSHAGQTNLTGPTAGTVLVGANQLTVEGQDGPLTWKLTYTRTGQGRITKSLTLAAERDLRLDRVALWTAHEPPARVARTELQDIAVFYRHHGRGLFASLDFPYSRVMTQEGAVSVTYPPSEHLAAGQRHECHSLTVGAVRLSGRERYGSDTGEVEAMDRYVQERFRPRFERPMFVSCSIVNRYTQVAGDTVFYTQKDHPTLWMNQDLLRREIALMPRLGMEYYQVFPGVFDWGTDDPSPAAVKDLVAYSRERGVRMGDYSGCNVLFCAHYAEYRNRLDRPEWQMRAANGALQGTHCFGCSEFVDYYLGTVARNSRQFGFELHCLDFLALGQCHAANHGHPAGEESLYAQVRGLTRLLEGINAVSPEMMTWSNSGNWSGLLPKIAWTNPNLYLTDPFIATPWQGLNMTRLLDDARREQMVSLHYSRFIPYRFLSNCQYFFSQNSVSPDIRNYQYGALSTLAVTPNLCLGEIRPWIDRLSPADQEAVLRFYQTWTRFLNDHFEFWKKTYHAGENPGPGAVEVYAHTIDNRGFIFLVNPQYWDRDVRVPLGGELGFSGTAWCEITELHPVRKARLIGHRPFVRLGETISLPVAAQSVVVLEVKSAAKTLDVPRLFGLPGTVEPTAGGYLVKTTGRQGTRETAALVIPGANTSLTSAVVRADVPKQPKRQWSATSVTLEGPTNGLTWGHRLSSDGAETILEGQVFPFSVQFRRDMAPRELRRWQVRRGSLASGMATNWSAGFEGETFRFPLFVDCEPAVPLPITNAAADHLGLGPLATFCGAYVENAFSEPQETWIEWRIGPQQTSSAGSSKLDIQSGAPVDPTNSLAPAMTSLAKDAAGQWWVQTRFHLPFMYTIGSEPAFDEHTLLVLPFLHSRLKDLKAWINGQPLEVQRYRYPRNRALSTFYADLVGTAARGGENTLVIYFDASSQ
jgi:hypothetical protein